MVVLREPLLQPGDLRLGVEANAHARLGQRRHPETIVVAVVASAAAASVLLLALLLLLLLLRKRKREAVQATTAVGTVGVRALVAGGGKQISTEVWMFLPNEITCMNGPLRR